MIGDVPINTKWIHGMVLRLNYFDDDNDESIYFKNLILNLNFYLQCLKAG